MQDPRGRLQVIGRFMVRLVKRAVAWMDGGMLEED